MAMKRRRDELRVEAKWWSWLKMQAAECFIISCSLFCIISFSWDPCGQFSAFHVMLVSKRLPMINWLYEYVAFPMVSFLRLKRNERNIKDKRTRNTEIELQTDWMNRLQRRVSFAFRFTISRDHWRPRRSSSKFTCSLRVSSKLDW